MSLGQYLKDTRAELRHVAWPTQTQTIVFTVLVALVSIFVAAYLGIFDYLFTTSLARFLGVSTQSALEITQNEIVASTTPAIDVTFGTSTKTQ